MHGYNACSTWLCVSCGVKMVGGCAEPSRAERKNKKEGGGGRGGVAQCEMVFVRDVSKVYKK